MQVTATYSTAYQFRGKLVRMVHILARSSMYRSSGVSLGMDVSKRTACRGLEQGNEVARCVSCDGAGSTGRIRDLRLNHQMEHEKGRGFPLGALAEIPPRNSLTQPRSMFPRTLLQTTAKVDNWMALYHILVLHSSTLPRHGKIKLYHTSLARGLRPLVDRPLIRRQDAISDLAGWSGA